MTDWYRNTTWNPEIAAAFHARLKRSRSQKAQYLRLQGISLAGSHPAAALELLTSCVDLCDADETERALTAIAGIYLARGDVEEAITTFDLAIQQEALVSSGVHTNAPLDYCFMVTFHSRIALYDRAWDVLETLPPVEFGATGYARNGATAIILAHRNNLSAAAPYATKALISALDTHDGNLPAGLKPNPDALVKQIDNPFTARLVDIVALAKAHAANNGGAA